LLGFDTDRGAGVLVLDQLLNFGGQHGNLRGWSRPPVTNPAAARSRTRIANQLQCAKNRDVRCRLLGLHPLPRVANCRDQPMDLRQSRQAANVLDCLTL
jgi:hypothetical protein